MKADGIFYNLYEFVPKLREKLEEYGFEIEERNENLIINSPGIAGSFGEILDNRILIIYREKYYGEEISNKKIRKGTLDKLEGIMENFELKWEKRLKDYKYIKH